MAQTNLRARVWVSRSEAKNIRRFAMREGDEELADRFYRAEPEGRRQAPFLWRWQRVSCNVLNPWLQVVS